MTRMVRIRGRANLDLIRHACYIGQRYSLRTAVRWRHQIEECIQELADDADIWPVADEELEIDLRFRAFGKKPNVYRILFTIDGDTVNVLRIRHAAQDAITSDDL